MRTNSNIKPIKQLEEEYERLDRWVTILKRKEADFDVLHKVLMKFDAKSDELLQRYEEESIKSYNYYGL